MSAPLNASPPRGSERGNRFSPTGYEMLTRSGTMVDVRKPTAAIIRLSDIAAGLSTNVRFAGQCPLEPTVAEHSLAVEYIAGALLPDEFGLGDVDPRHLVLAVRRAALMHDAPEGYLTDITGCVKLHMRPKLAGVAARGSGHEFGRSPYDHLELAWMAAIEEALDCACPDEFHGLIYEADCIACAYEMSHAGWCSDAHPPAWAAHDPYVQRCYDTIDGGRSAFTRRARMLGIS